VLLRPFDVVSSFGSVLHRIIISKIRQPSVILLPPEEAGFELSRSHHEKSGRLEAHLDTFARSSTSAERGESRGTDGSNPVLSSRESNANLTCPEETRRPGVGERPIPPQWKNPRLAVQSAARIARR
jgi:hypothetical protein